MIRTSLAVCGALAVALGATAASAQSVTLKFASFVPPQSFAATQVLDPFFAAVEKESGGEVKVQPFYGGSLGRSPIQQYKLVTDNVTDIGFVQPQYTSGQFPDSSLFELPYLFRDGEEGSVAMWRMFERGMLTGYDEVKVLGIYMSDLLAIHTRQPIKRLEDLRGMKIRASGRAATDFLKLFGAAPIGMETTRVTEALDRGVLDGTMTNWNGLYTFRSHNVVHHHYVAPLSTIVFIIPMNKRTWEGLSSNAKAAFEKAGGERMARLAGGAYVRGDRALFEKFKGEAERTFVVETDEQQAAGRQAMQPLYDQWIAETPDGQEKFDTLQKILSEVRAGG